MAAIHHIGLFVNNLEQAKEFYMTYFDATAGDMYHNPRTGLKTYMLSFKGGSKIEIMNRPETEDGSPRNTFQCGYAHIALHVSSKENVDTLTMRLKADGYPIVSMPRTTGDGYYESCVADAEGNFIEIVTDTNH